MWIFKAAGAALLVCSGIAVAAQMNRTAEAALRQNEGIMALLRAVRGQIECFSLPIGQILAACDRDLLLACGYTEEEKPRDLGEILSRMTVWDARTVSIFSQFAAEFGRGYREDEVRACDYALSLLEERRGVLAKDLPVKKKRNMTLSVCGALALALLLL